MMEFVIIEDALDGEEGFGPHMLEVWFPKGTKKDIPVFATLVQSPVTWLGEQLRVEEFAKQVANAVRNVWDNGVWEVEITYSEPRQRWSANARHIREDGTTGLQRIFTEWGGF